MPLWRAIFDRRILVDPTLVVCISENTLLMSILQIEKLDEQYELEGILQLDAWVVDKPATFIWKGAEKFYTNIKII